MDESATVGDRGSRRSVLSCGNGRHSASGSSRSRKSSGHGYSGRHSRSTRGELDNGAAVWANALPTWYHYGTISLTVITVTASMIITLIRM